MTNFDVARKSLQTALNDADGSGERELESWNKGIEASLSHLKAQFQDFSTSAISSDMFKGIVSIYYSSISSWELFIYGCIDIYKYCKYRINDTTKINICM